MLRTWVKNGNYAVLHKRYISIAMAQLDDVTLETTRSAESIRHMDVNILKKQSNYAPPRVVVSVIQSCRDLEGRGVGVIYTVARHLRVGKSTVK